MPFSEIASRTLLAESASRGKFQISVRLGMPVCLEDDEWECPVALDGLHENLRATHGVDSWQALMLAQKLARLLLEGFLEDGGALRDVESEQPVNLAEFFAHDGSA